MATIYKICDRKEWEKALQDRAFRGSTVDLRDGFIHFSAAHQLRETARRHFAARTDLVLLAVEADALGPELRWEKSRGGDLFPHLYQALDVNKVHSVAPLPWRETAHQFPEGIP
jgi:uncharacterized protein (DUF952 family)